MFHYKQIEDNYIVYMYEIPTELKNENIIPILLEEYYSILKIIANKPADTETIRYMLNADTLEYEPTPAPEPQPEPEPTYTLDEAAGIIAQEVSQNGYDA